MNILYRIYQLFIAAPLILLATFLTAVITWIGGILGNAHFWGYWPGKLWSMFICKSLFLPVRINGLDNIDKNTSYVFVANHQGSFDIFLIYGYLSHNFKWMMKQEIRRIPFVGPACEKAGHIFIDRGSQAGLKESLDKCKATLREGTSLVVFPEGTRTLNGRMRPFKKGAFTLAQELELPVVPVTLNGPFQILPRQKGLSFVRRSPLSITYHKPIPVHHDTDLKQLIDESRQAINASLPADFKE